METREKYIIISGKVVPCKVIRKIRSRYLIDTGMERFTVEPGRLMDKQRPQDIPFWEKRPGIPGDMATLNFFTHMGGSVIL